MWLLRSSKHYIINNQGRNQISEEDEASQDEAIAMLVTALITQVIKS